MVSGRFCIEMEGERLVLGPGDLVRVPRGGVPSADVVGSETVVSFDAVSEVLTSG